MVFRKGGYLGSRERWMYGNKQIKVTNSYKYLGMGFTTKLSIRSAMKDVCIKGKRGVIEIQKSMKKLNTADLELFWKMFDTQIEPILTYASEVWGLCEEGKLIEKVHTFAIKRLLSVSLHASNNLVYGESGRYPLYIRIYVKSIKYWLKLVSLPASRICSQAYEMLVLQHETGRHNWVSNVQKTLCEQGFGIVWLSQGVGCEYSFINEFKDRLISCYKQNWHSEIENNDKYRWYSSFKSVFQAERYLSFITNKWYKISLSRFRLRVSGLKNCKYWFLNEYNSNDNMCPSCRNATEDEVHFLFDCVAYSEKRRNCETLSVLTGTADMNSVINILSDSSEEKIKSISKFIGEAMNIRKKITEQNI